MIVANTLPETLKHFEDELSDTLPRYELRPRRFAGEGTKQGGRIVQLLRYLRFVRSVRREGVPVLVLWPLLGWLDLIVWGAFARQRTVVMIHDPVPLRRQVGMDTGSLRLTRLATRWLRQLEVVVLSREAQAVVDAALPNVATRLLPHPILAPAAQERQGAEAGDRLLVLGQYKPARDLELLERLAPHVSELGLRPVVRGRGWPEIEGWDVQEGFLSEEDFKQELSAASVLLVPYKHYFQSNVAARALESGVPVVGVKTDFMVSLLGEDAPTLVHEDSLTDWLDAIHRAEAAPADSLHREVWERVCTAWSGFDAPPKANGNGE